MPDLMIFSSACPGRSSTIVFGYETGGKTIRLRRDAATLLWSYSMNYGKEEETLPPMLGLLLDEYLMKLHLTTPAVSESESGVGRALVIQ